MRSRTTWIGTSWKMTKTLAEARAFIDEFLAGLIVTPLPSGLQAFVLPPHTALAAVRDRLGSRSEILLGAQNAHWSPEGAGTGEISMRMAADAGARIIEIGHSERRESFGETDATVAAKTAAALALHLVPLVCVGEPESVRRDRGQADFVAGQVRAALAPLSPTQVGEVLVAYEPVWAIGERGRPARPSEIGPELDVIAQLGRELSPTGLRGVLYGGSVDAGNALGLLDNPSVDGLFVGRAAWTAQGFLQILRLAADRC